MERSIRCERSITTMHFGYIGFLDGKAGLS